MKFHNPDSLYHMFFEIIRLHYSRSHALLEKSGVYPGQPPMLFALAHKDGQSQKELAQRLKIKPATITVMLNRMEKSGLVERRPDPEDQRVSRVFITDKGREIWREVGELMKTMEEECFSNFTPDEKIVLRRLLMQMRDNLMKASDGKIKCEE